MVSNDMKNECYNYASVFGNQSDTHDIGRGPMVTKIFLINVKDVSSQQYFLMKKTSTSC